MIAGVDDYEDWMDSDALLNQAEAPRDGYYDSWPWDMEEA